MDTPFDHRTGFHWTDLDLARDQVAYCLCPHELSLTGRDQLDARMWSQRIGINGSVAIIDISYGAGVEIVPGELTTFHVMMIPARGNSVIRCGGRQVNTGPGTAAVPHPDHRLHMRWSPDSAQRVVRFERPALQAVLGDLLGYVPPQQLEFLSLGMDTSRGGASVLCDELERAAVLLEQDPHAFDHSYVARATEQMLMARLLYATPHNYSKALSDDQGRAPSRTIRRAVDIVESDPAGNHTVLDLARAVGVSRRTLERGFDDELGVSPWQYVRAARLRRARDLLRATDPAETSIADIAHRVGMTHSNFSAGYRRQFGETPVQTQRRSTRRGE